MESAFFTVADWVANPRSNSIRRKNRRSVLPPRLMDLLFYFAQHPMEVVSRQEIIDNCWDRDVVTDQAITQAIFELRKFLKDGRSAKEAPEYIKTVPKRGYRLLAPVHQLTVEEYIAATSENGAQGTEVIDDEDAAAERELQQPVRAAEPEHEAATSFESKILEETDTAALEQIPARSAAIKQERRGKVTPPPRAGGRPGVPLKKKRAAENVPPPPPRAEGRRGQEKYFQQDIRRIVAGSSDLRL